MIDAAAVMLWVTGRLPWYAALVILSRDVLMVVGYRLVVNRGYDFEVTRVGKLATWVLYFAIGFCARHGRRRRLAACGSSGSASGLRSWPRRSTC